MITALAFTIGFLVLLGMAVARHPIYGLYAYMAAFFIHPPSRWWGELLPDLRWSLLSALVTFVALRLHRTRLEPAKHWLSGGPAALIVAYCGYMWLQCLWALDMDLHLPATIQYTKYLVAYYFFYRVADTTERTTHLAVAYVLGCATLGFMAFFENDRVGGRLDGVGGPGIGDANTLGMVFATSVAIGSMLVLSLRGRLQWICIGAMPLVLNGLVLTASRGAFLGVAAATLVLVAVKPSQFARVFWGLSLLALALTAVVVDQRFLDRMLTIKEAVDGEVDESAQSRLALKEAQLRMFIDYPMGGGHKSTAVLSSRYLDARYLAHSYSGESLGIRSSHNTFLTALVEQGVIGAFLFVALIGWWFLATLRLRRLRKRTEFAREVALAGGLLAGIGAVLAAGMFTDYLMAEVQFWMFALVAALLARLPAGQSARAAIPDGHLDVGDVTRIPRAEVTEFSATLNGGAKR